jgi:hypothetical protein
MRNLLLAVALVLAGTGASATPDARQMALVKSATKGDLAAVTKLLNAGVSPNSHDAHNLTALNWAAYNDHGDIVKLLIAKHAAVDSHGNPSGWTPLMNAANGGHDGVVSLLLAAGAAVNATDKYGDPPIWFAALAHKTATVKLLQAHGATDDVSRLILGQALCEAARTPLASPDLEWGYPDEWDHGHCDAVKHDFPGGPGDVVMFTYAVSGDRNGARTLTLLVNIYDDTLPKDVISATVQPLLTNIFAGAARGTLPDAVASSTAALADLNTDTPLGKVTAHLTPGSDAALPTNGAEYRIDIALK